MRLVVDTGVLSATLNRRRQPMFDEPVRRLQGHQIFLAAVTVAELRYGAIIAAWGAPRRMRIETAIAETMVVPVTDALITAVAEMRAACRHVGHPLADRIHANDLGIAASAVHIAPALVTADSIFEGAPGLGLAQ